MTDQNSGKEGGKPVSDEPKRSFLGRIRTYFFTGVVIIAPAAITVWATLWFISLFDSVVKPMIPLHYNPDTYLPFKVPGTGLVVALLIITAVGALAANLVGRTLIGWWDSLIHKTPVVRSVYKGTKQIFETLFSEKGTSFRHVCLVEWPRRDAWSIAFISRELDGSEVGLEARPRNVCGLCFDHAQPDFGLCVLCRSEGREDSRDVGGRWFEAGDFHGSRFPGQADGKGRRSCSCTRWQRMC